MTERHAVYRFYNGAGDLLYIGESYDPLTRWKQHAKTKEWWDEVAQFRLEWWPSFEEAAKQERLAILAENPRYNVERHEVVWERPRKPPHWTPPPQELVRAFRGAGQRMRNARTRRDRAGLRKARALLGALAYEGYMLGCQPKPLYKAAHIDHGLMIRLLDRHLDEHPDLPAPPSRPAMQRSA